MRVAAGLAGDRAQPKTLVGAEIRGLEPAVVEHQRFAFAVFEKELAVVGAFDRVGHDGLEALLRAIEHVRKGFCHRTVSFTRNGLPNLGT
jgi:hypothetical protein